MADRGVEGGRGQQPGRVQNQRARGATRHQERDLSAHQTHRVTARCHQPLDDAGIFLSIPMRQLNRTEHLTSYVLTTLVEEHLGLSLSAARRKEEDLLIQLAEIPSTGISVGTAVTQLAYLPALAQNRKSEDPATQYNRHTSVHRVSRQQYTLANALIALMHAVAVLRQLEFVKQ